MEICWENGCRYPLVDKTENGTEGGGAALTLDCEEERLYVSHGWVDIEGFWFDHGELSWEVSQCLTRDEANELLEKAAPLAEKVIEGYSARNGRLGRKAHYDEDAKEAIAKIQEIALSYSYPSDEDDFYDWVYENGKYHHIPKIEVRRIGSEEDPYPLYHVDERDGEVLGAYLHFNVNYEELWVDWGYEDTARHKNPHEHSELIWEISPYLRYDQINELLDKAAPHAFDLVDDREYDPVEGMQYGSIDAISEVADEFNEHQEGETFDGDRDVPPWIAMNYEDYEVPSWLEKNREDFTRWLEKRNNEAAGQQPVNA